MSFQYEEDAAQSWTTMQAEHELVKEAIQPVGRRRGVVDYLCHRAADPARAAVMYYVDGLGMGQGMRFALAHAGHILWIDVWNRGENPVQRTISAVEIPEQLNERRGEYLGLVMEAMGVYFRALPYMLMASPEPMICAANVAWKMLPRRYSRLYWKTESTAWLRKHKSKAARVVNFVKSPLVAVLALLGSVLFAKASGYSAMWPLIVGGVWVWWRMDDLDDNCYFLPWLVGVNKSKKPMATVAAAMGSLSQGGGAQRPPSRAQRKQ